MSKKLGNFACQIDIINNIQSQTKLEYLFFKNEVDVGIEFLHRRKLEYKLTVFWWIFCKAFKMHILLLYVKIFF